MDETWRDHAACKDVPDPNDFIDGNFKTQERLITMYCAVCPVTDPCLEVGLSVASSSDEGVWGGTTHDIRRRIRRARRSKVR